MWVCFVLSDYRCAVAVDFEVFVDLWIRPGFAVGLLGLVTCGCCLGFV